MGSYIKILGQELNSKTYCRIAMDIIRELDENLREKGKTKKELNILVPEFYKENEDGKKIGCGEWVIKRKGMALIVLRLQDTLDDDETIRLMAIKYNHYPLSKIENEDEKMEKLQKYEQEMKNDILKVYKYFVEIFSIMILDNRKKIKLKWI